MPTRAKIFTIDDDQTLRFPVDYGFNASEVYIRRDTATGDVILSSHPANWDGLFEALEAANFSEDFLRPED